MGVCRRRGAAAPGRLRVAARARDTGSAAALLACALAGVLCAAHGPAAVAAGAPRAVGKHEVDNDEAETPHHAHVHAALVSRVREHFASAGSHPCDTDADCAAILAPAAKRGDVTGREAFFCQEVQSCDGGLVRRCAEYVREGGACGHREACEEGAMVCAPGLACDFTLSQPAGFMCAGGCPGTCVAPPERGSSGEGGGESDVAAEPGMTAVAGAAFPQNDSAANSSTTPSGSSYVPIGGACGWDEFLSRELACKPTVAFCNHSNPHGGAEVCPGGCKGTCEPLDAASAPQPTPGKDEGDQDGDASGGEIGLDDDEVDDSARRAACAAECAEEDAGAAALGNSYCSISNHTTSPCQAVCMGEPIRCNAACPCRCPVVASADANASATAAEGAASSASPAGIFTLMLESVAATCGAAEDDANPCANTIELERGGELVSAYADCPMFPRARCYNPMRGCASVEGHCTYAEFYDPERLTELTAAQCCGASTGAPGDLDGSGALDQNDLAELLGFMTSIDWVDDPTAFSRCDLLRHDINADGEVTADDVLMLNDMILSASTPSVAGNASGTAAGGEGGAADSNATESGGDGGEASFAVAVQPPAGAAKGGD